MSQASWISTCVDFYVILFVFLLYFDKDTTKNAHNVCQKLRSFIPKGVIWQMCQGCITDVISRQHRPHVLCTGLMRCWMSIWQKAWKIGSAMCQDSLSDRFRYISNSADMSGRASQWLRHWRLRRRREMALKRLHRVNGGFCNRDCDCRLRLWNRS